jgi:hypothetical protein
MIGVAIGYTDGRLSAMLLRFSDIQLAFRFSCWRCPSSRRSALTVNPVGSWRELSGPHPSQGHAHGGDEFGPRQRHLHPAR